MTKLQSRKKGNIILISIVLCERLHLGLWKLRLIASRNLRNPALDCTETATEFRRGQFFFVVGARGAHCTPTLFRSFNPFTPVRAPPRRPAARG